MHVYQNTDSGPKNDQKMTRTIWTFVKIDKLSTIYVWKNLLIIYNSIKSQMSWTFGENQTVVRHVWIILVKKLVFSVKLHWRKWAAKIHAILTQINLIPFTLDTDYNVPKFTISVKLVLNSIKIYYIKNWL